MRIVLQRVSSASVQVDGRLTGSIDSGVLLLVGVGPRDTPGDISWLARKIAGLRIFPDDMGRMNIALRDAGAACLTVSQFTLYGDCSRGFRPGFSNAAPPEKARADFDAFVMALRQEGLRVETGCFQAHMEVRLVNDGPVTLLLEREAGG